MTSAYARRALDAVWPALTLNRESGLPQRSILKGPQYLVILEIGLIGGGSQLEQGLQHFVAQNGAARLPGSHGSGVPGRTLARAR